MKIKVTAEGDNPKAFGHNIAAILEAALMTCMEPDIFPRFVKHGQETALEEIDGLPPMPEIAEWFGKLNTDALAFVAAGLLEGNHDEV